MNYNLSIIGLATKAGKTVSGEWATEKAVKEQKAKLVIVAQDASDNTKKLFKNKCEYYNVMMITAGSKQELGSVTGKANRASLAVTDENFAKAIIKKINAHTN